MFSLFLGFSFYSLILIGTESASILFLVFCILFLVFRVLLFIYLSILLCFVLRCFFRCFVFCAVSGCLVLLLQRTVKTFRLGPHPAPIIPVDVVSRAIVHSALGWGGPLLAAATTTTATTTTATATTPTTAAAAAAAASPFPSFAELEGKGLMSDDVSDNHANDKGFRGSSGGGSGGGGRCGGWDGGGGGGGRGGGSGDDRAVSVGKRSEGADARGYPDVVIRNLAWATHPVESHRRRRRHRALGVKRDDDGDDNDDDHQTGGGEGKPTKGFCGEGG